MIDKILKNKNIAIFIISVFIYFLLVFLSLSGVFSEFNSSIQNNYYGIKNKILNTEASKELIVVEIDGKTTRNIGRFPFDRKVYAQFIDNLKETNSGVIAFDIIFADKSETNSDNLFSEAIKTSKNIVLGLSLDNKLLEFPIDIFKEHIKSSGYYHPIIKNATDTIYSIQPFSKFLGSKTYEHFVISILKSYFSLIHKKDYLSQEKEIVNNSISITDDIKVPLSRNNNNEILINYINSSKFNKVSFIDIYDKESFKGLQTKIDFKDKIILVGAVAKGIKDIFNSPYGPNEYGVYMHANMINTILTETYLKYFNKNIEWLIIFLLILLSVYLNISRTGYTLIFSNIAIISIFIIVFPLIVIVSTNLILNYPIELIFSLILSLISSNIYKYLTENKNKEKLNKALGEYVSKNIAKEILSGSGNINLDGENKQVSIFFSDIEGFTTISEKFSPEELVGFLREYLGEMSHIIMDEKGFINKYEGDAIMALWGCFLDVPNKKNSSDACLSALKQQKLLKQLNIGWTKKGFSLIKVRIGIHRGPSIIGNIGAEGRKMEFTALGDSVNLASRLEGVNKFYGTHICVSEDVYLDVKEDFEFRYLDKIKVKGKDKPIVIYELLDFKGQLSQVEKDIISDFISAIKLYLNKDFEEALKIFSKLEIQGDKPSITYKKRCNMYINDKTLEFDPIWTMDSK